VTLTFDPDKLKLMAARGFVLLWSQLIVVLRLLMSAYTVVLYVTVSFKRLQKFLFPLFYFYYVWGHQLEFVIITCCYLYVGGVFVQHRRVCLVGQTEDHCCSSQGMCDVLRNGCVVEVWSDDMTYINMEW